MQITEVSNGLSALSATGQQLVLLLLGGSVSVFLFALFWAIDRKPSALNPHWSSPNKNRYRIARMVAFTPCMAFVFIYLGLYGLGQSKGPTTWAGLVWLTVDLVALGVLGLFIEQWACALVKRIEHLEHHSAAALHRTEAQARRLMEQERLLLQLKLEVGEQCFDSHRPNSEKLEKQGALFHWDLERHTLSMSPRWCEFFGLNPNDLDEDSLAVLRQNLFEGQAQRTRRQIEALQLSPLAKH